MKIVIDARFFGTETGIGRYVKELVENLERVDLKNQYVIFLREKNWDLYSPKNKNFSKKCLDLAWYSLKEQLFLGAAVDREKADLAHFPHFNVPFFCRTPYVITIHDVILHHFPTSAASTKNPAVFYIKYFFYNLILKNALRRAKKIIVPSYFVRNDIIGLLGVAPDKIRIVRGGLSNLPKIDLGEEYLKTKNITAPYLLYIGNSYPHKNLEMLVRAFEILKKEKPDLQLVLAGKQDYFSERLQFAVGSKQLAVNFYGYASDEEIVALYRHAALYVFPSLMEGFGLPLLETLSFGLPAAVSDIPVFHEILGGAAFYFNPKDANDMARVIKNVLQDDAARDKILAEGKNILPRYNWTRNAQEIKEVYHAARV